MIVEHNIGMDFQANRLFDHYFRNVVYIENKNGIPLSVFLQKIWLPLARLSRIIKS